VVFSRERSVSGYEAWALRLQGEVVSRHEPADIPAAQDHYNAAMALASDLEMRPLIAHCHLGLGKLHRRTGESEQAQEHLSTATTMYREMEMRFWLEQAEVEIRALV
jgi:hypothetical protein